MAQIEDRLRALENRKRSHDLGPAEPLTQASTSPREPLTANQQERYSSVFTSIESDDSDTTSRLALALGSGEIGKRTLRGYLKETLVYTGLEVRRSSKLWTTWT